MQHRVESSRPALVVAAGAVTAADRSAVAQSMAELIWADHWNTKLTY